MHPARELWRSYEPLNAVAYFHETFRSGLVDLGLTRGWDFYFARRVAPLGTVSVPVVTASFFSFSPSRIEKSVPAIWETVTPSEVIESTLVSAATVLKPVAALVGPERRARALSALEQAADAADFGGRLLGAAWAGVERPDDELARLWLAAATLREHRGDGHIMAAATAGLSGLQTVITHVASGGVERELVQRSRGWTDEEWDAATEELAARGLVESDGTLSTSGAELRERVEADTDRLTESALATIIADGSGEVLETLRMMARDLIDRGDVAVPNPMGLTRA